MKIGFIGAGNMGGAIAISVSNVIKKSDSILLSDCNKEKAEALARKIGGKSVEIAEIFADCDMIFFGVKPQSLPQLAESLHDMIKERMSKGREFLAVTMAAGVDLKHFAEMFGDFPTVRIMPNTPVAVGEGMIFWAAGSHVSSEQIESFKYIMGGAGRLCEINEDQIDAAGALSGCGPAFVYMFIEALADGGVAVGLARKTAQEAAIQTLIGAATLALQSGKHPGELKDEVCSPGGTTIEGVRILESRAFRSAASDAVVAAYNKTKNIK